MEKRLSYNSIVWKSAYKSVVHQTICHTFPYYQKKRIMPVLYLFFGTAE